MGQLPRSKSRRLRRAVAGSVVVHLLLVSVGAVAFRSGGGASRHGQPELDTRADDVTLRISVEDVAVAAPTPEPIRPPDPTPPEPEPQPTPEPPVASQPQPRPESTATGRPPVKTTVPNALPSEVTALIRRPARPAVADPNVKPAGAVAAASTPAIHGGMKAGQTVVYVLDCSGSMGEFGKLTLARAALVSTLRRQSADVKFQVLAYSSAPRSLLPGICVVASPANITTAESALTTLKAMGRSNHVEAVRAAAALRPDVIVLLTDAEELSPAAFKSALAGRSVPVCVARVSAEGVGAPRELK